MPIVFGSEQAKKVLQADREKREREEQAKSLGNRKSVKCPTCKGSGDCQTCNGDGCIECEGMGCSDCDGLGNVEMEYHDGQWWYVLEG